MDTGNASTRGGRKIGGGYQSTPAAGRLGMIVLLLSLSVLFAAGIVGYLVVRLRAPDWPPPGAPGFSYGLWVSTAVLMASGVTMQMALWEARADRLGRLKIGMAATTFLGIAFLLCQIWNWKTLMAEELTVGRNLYGFTFYVLTGLHGAHVLGGIIPLAVVTVKAFRSVYSSDYHPGVLYCAMYWHFLAVVWIILFSLLVLGSTGASAAAASSGVPIGPRCGLGCVLKQ